MNEEVEITLLQDDVTVETPLVADYILPTATANTLGGVKIGDNININTTGHISVPVASQSSLGVVQAGTGINIDTNGVISANGEGYTLPEATKTTLGGVYMDDELSTTSTHPVQNSVVALEFQEVNGDISTLTGTTSGLSTTVGNLSTTVGNLGTTVGNLSGTVTNQGNDISTIQGNITSLGTRVGGCEGDITDLGNTVGAMGALVNDLADEFNEVADGTDIDSNIWTQGDVQIRKRGRAGVVYITLEGSLTLASLSSTTIYTQSDQENLPAYTGYGVIYTDIGCVYGEFTTSGELNIYNNSSTSLNIGELKGSIPILYS